MKRIIKVSQSIVNEGSFSIEIVPAEEEQKDQDATYYSTVAELAIDNPDALIYSDDSVDGWMGCPGAFDLNIGHNQASQCFHVELNLKFVRPVVREFLLNSEMLGAEFNDDTGISLYSSEDCPGLAIAYFSLIVDRSFLNAESSFSDILLGDFSQELRLYRHMLSLSGKGETRLSKICEVTDRTVEYWFSGRKVPTKSTQEGVRSMIANHTKFRFEFVEC